VNRNIPHLFAFIDKEIIGADFELNPVLTSHHLAAIYGSRPQQSVQPKPIGIVFGGISVVTG
jgi:hypothetical protein